ncbi:MAG: hypothetical protein OXG58_07135 [Gemmatimonadetes bacterium]|nr:hypothetical protein [Gemmatimonadota bacterium]MCY3943914.1 hypothetical protein [Gemmatimonadota bacterium]
MTGKRFPFEASFPELADRIDYYVKQVFEALTSDPLTSFLVLPRGPGYVSRQAFVRGYDALAEATVRFESLDEDAVLRAVLREPMALIVLRTMLGLSPPEWASVTTTQTGERIDQGFARNLERSIRMDPARKVGHTPIQATRIRAMVSVACGMLREGALRASETEVHRLDKVDTARGLESLKQVASQGVRYEALLYERLLGRPFASHRDSVSELVGDMLEDRIEDHLSSANVPYHRSRRGESMPGWEQNPDFFCPDPRSPLGVIEAKMTNDDGTARDKVARVLRLAAIRDNLEHRHRPGFEVIACIAGRGFAVRKADMKDLLIATRGKVFTFSQIDRLAECTMLGRRST